MGAVEATGGRLLGCVSSIHGQMRYEIHDLNGARMETGVSNDWMTGKSCLGKGQANWEATVLLRMSLPRGRMNRTVNE